MPTRPETRTPQMRGNADPLSRLFADHLEASSRVFFHYPSYPSPPPPINADPSVSAQAEAYTHKVVEKPCFTSGRTHGSPDRPLRLSGCAKRDGVVGAYLRVRPFVGADFLEGFLPVGVPVPDIRSICEPRVSGGHAGPPLREKHSPLRRAFSTAPMREVECEWRMSVQRNPGNLPLVFF